MNMDPDFRLEGSRYRIRYRDCSTSNQDQDSCDTRENDTDHKKYQPNHGGICSGRLLRPCVRLNRMSSILHSRRSDPRNITGSRSGSSPDGDNSPEGRQADT